MAKQACVFLVVDQKLSRAQKKRRKYQMTNQICHTCVYNNEVLYVKICFSRKTCNDTVIFFFYWPSKNNNFLSLLKSQPSLCICKVTNY